MVKANIKLNTVSNAKEFLNITSGIDCDIDLIKGSYTIDAKSVMGVFALDLSEPLELNIHSDDESLLNLFSKWIVK